jgi:hypothetical protein
MAAASFGVCDPPEVGAAAAAHSLDADRWWTEFGTVIDRIAPRFSWYEPLRHAAGLMLGMILGLDRKNCRTIDRRGDRSRMGCSATVTINGATQTFPPEMPQAQREILANLGIQPGY